MAQYNSNMKPKLILLAVLIVLYLVPSYALQAVYGDSYGFLAGSDHWKPDGHGGWAKQGNPSEPPPSRPSENIPLILLYLPILLPGLVLAAFLFTPLSRKLEPPIVKEDDAGASPDNEATTGQEGQ